MKTPAAQHIENLDAIYWAEVAGDRRNRPLGAGNRPEPLPLPEGARMFDPSRVFVLESQADLHALRAIGSSSLTVYVIAVPGGWRLSLTQDEGSVTRWMRYGCTSLRNVAPLVEVRF